MSRRGERKFEVWGNMVKVKPQRLMFLTRRAVKVYSFFNNVGKNAIIKPPNRVVDDLE